MQNKIKPLWLLFIFISCIYAITSFYVPSCKYIKLIEIINNLSLGFVSAGIFYYFVNYLPEKRKKVTLKNSLRKSYSDTKRRIADNIIWASVAGGRQGWFGVSLELENNILDYKKFREIMQGSEDNEGWYAFVNGALARRDYIKDILTELKIFSNEIHYCLLLFPAYDNSFNNFRELQNTIFQMENIDFDSDDNKIFFRFLYELFARFNFIDGIRDEDVIEKLIDDL